MFFLVAQHEGMEHEDTLDTLGIGGLTTADVPEDQSKWLYGEGKLRAIGRTAHMLFGSTDLDRGYNVEQVNQVSAVRERY